MCPEPAQGWKGQEEGSGLRMEECSERAGTQILLPGQNNALVQRARHHHDIRQATCLHSAHLLILKMRRLDLTPNLLPAGGVSHS